MSKLALSSLRESLTTVGDVYNLCTMKNIYQLKSYEN